MVLCQPVTDAPCRVRESVRDNESNKKQNLCTLRVQLFPTNNWLEVENERKDDKQRVALNEESNEEEDQDQTETLNEENDEQQILTIDTQVALMNEDLILAQIMNQNKHQMVTIDPQVAVMNENLPLAQTMNHNEIDTDTCDTLNIP